MDACPLHGNQHGNQRTLERLVHAAQLLLRQQTPEDGSELPREIGALSGVIEGCFGRYVGERDRLRAAATYVFFDECLVARVLEGKILEPVFRSAGIDQIAREHRVDVESTQRDVVPGEHECVELHVVADLADRCVFEHRAERVERLVHRQRRRAEAAVSRRHVVGITRRGRERKADDVSAHRARLIGQHPEGKPPRGPQPIDQRAHRFRRGGNPVRLADRPRRRRVLLGETPERELVEDLKRSLARAAAVADRLGVEVHRHAGSNPCELLTLSRGIGMPEQPLTIAFVLDFGGVLKQVVERAISGDQLAGALVADAGHALDVVDRVAHQREDVDHLLRRHTKLLLDGGGVVPGALVARVEHADAVANELKEVLVERDDDRVEAGVDGLQRQRPDDVVGFIAIRCDDGDAERFACRMHHRDLDGELIGHRRAIGLVIPGQIVTERAAGQIERRRDVLRLVLVEQLAQHRDEDVHGIGRLPLRVAEQTAVGGAHRRVIRAVHLRAAVDEIDDRSGRHRKNFVAPPARPRHIARRGGAAKFLLYHWRLCGFAAARA